MRRPRFARRVLELIQARGVGVTAIGRSRWALSVSRGTLRLIVAEDRKKSQPFPLVVTLDRSAGEQQP